MELTPKRKFRLSAAGALFSVAFLVYMLSGSGPVGPPYRSEMLTAGLEPLMLVRQPSVIEELKLTEDQVQQIQDAANGQGGGNRQPNNNDGTTRTARMGRAHQEAFLAGVLNAEQNKRLNQIILQRQEGLALNNAKTAEALGLTEEQRKSVDAIVEKYASQQQAQFRNGFGGGGGGGRGGRNQGNDARAATIKELLGLLTPEQQSRWTVMLGEPFTGEITFGPRGGPGGQGRQPGGPGGQPPDANGQPPAGPAN